MLKTTSSNFACISAGKSIKSYQYTNTKKKKKNYPYKIYDKLKNKREFDHSIRIQS